MKQNVMDMTQGPIMSKLIRFGLPVLLGMLFQRIYNFADAYVVCRYLGDSPLGSVSISGMAMYLLMSLMMGLTTGVSVVISQYYGAGDEEKVRSTFTTSIYVSVIATAIITVAPMIGNKSSIPSTPAKTNPADSSGNTIETSARIPALRYSVFLCPK